MTQSKLPLAMQTHSLLPDNRSPLERALELALSEALYAIDPPYPQLLDAQHTLENALSTLAIERQVLVWDSDDSEQVQRKRAANAWRNRLLSGTRSGFIKALEQMGFGSQVTPWFALSPTRDPYHFQVWVYCTDRLLTADINVRIDALFEDMKSERDVYEIKLLRESIGTPCMAVATEVGVIMTSNPVVQQASDSSSLSYQGIAQHSRIISTSEPAYNERL